MSACRGDPVADNAGKRGEGGQKSENFADMICERSLCNSVSQLKLSHTINFKMQPPLCIPLSNFVLNVTFRKIKNITIRGFIIK